MSSLSKLFGALPPRIRIRFNGIPAYAKAVIEADEAMLRRERKTTAAEMQQIQAIVQLVLLDRFFQRGTEAARQAVRALEAIGTPGFSVGTTEFEGENEAVMRGGTLSRKLREAVPQLEGISSKLQKGESVSQVVLSIRNMVARG